ncbi:MAG: sulfite exporter TauE/SafE family protein [Alphaproteobacteria bacterium]|nr:sulfite exporter TauE/SafE family protein [Alphaproteobacteria bacterium]
MHDFRRPHKVQGRESFRLIDPSFQFVLIFLAGGLVGILSVIVGGGMFFSIPFLQWLFPGAPTGVIVGNLKAGSFFRGIGSTWSTFREIDFAQNLKISASAFVGTVVGASIIADISPNWLFPAIVFAGALSLAAPKIAQWISHRHFHVASLLTGFYAGILGAGIGILLIALLRLKYPEDADIAHVKIQARFVEWVLVIVAVITHAVHGNLVAAIWIPWSLGSLLGGFAGGSGLKKLVHLSGRTQKIVLYITIALAIAITAYNSFLRD